LWLRTCSNAYQSFAVISNSSRSKEKQASCQGEKTAGHRPGMPVSSFSRFALKHDDDASMSRFSR
jgi:hypothetical protein